MAVFSAGSEATYPHIGRNPWDPTGPNLYNPNAGVNSYSFRNPNGGVNSNSFRSSYNIYGPYKRRLYGKYPWDPARPNYYNLNAGGNTYSFSNPNDSFDSNSFRSSSSSTSTRIWCEKKCATQSRVCVSRIDGVAEMPYDDSIQPQVRKCSEGKTACIARC